MLVESVEKMIDHARTGRVLVTNGPELKVLKSVIVTDAVLVMNMLTLLDDPTKVLLQNKSMLRCPAFVSPTLVILRNFNEPISSAIEPTRTDWEGSTPWLGTPMQHCAATTTEPLPILDPSRYHLPTVLTRARGLLLRFVDIRTIIGAGLLSRVLWVKDFLAHSALLIIGTLVKFVPALPAAKPPRRSGNHPKVRVALLALLYGTIPTA